MHPDTLNHMACVWSLSPGDEVENPLVWPLVFKYFLQFKEKQTPNTFVTFAQRLCNSYNQANVPGQHMWPSPGPRPNSKCSKTVEIWCSCSKLNPIRARLPLRKSKKLHRAQQYKKLACQGNGVEMFSHCTILVIAHWAAHQPWKSENSELEI